MHHVRRVSRDESVLSVFRRGASRQHVEALEPRRVMSAAVRAAVMDLVPPDLSTEQSEYYEVSLVPDADYHDRDDGLWAIGTYLKADHDKPFIGKVATLHGDVLGDPSSYRVALKIDGVASNLPLALRATEAGIEVDVETSLPMGWHKFAVTVTDAAGRAAYTESAAFVTAPPIVGKGFTIAPVAGGEFTGEVAVFSGLKPEYIDDYVIGSNLPGSVASDLKLVHRAGDDAGTYRVVGKISYATPGLYDTTVSLSLGLPNDIGELHSGGAIWSRGWVFYDRMIATDRAYSYWGGYANDGASTDARGRAKVVNGRLAIDPELNSPTFYTNAGMRFRDTIARFDRLTGDAGASGHRFEIEATSDDFRGGTNASYNLPATLRVSAETIDVVVDRAFGKQQRIAFTVRIFDGDTQIGLTTGTIYVGHAMTVDPNRIVATEGASWTGEVGTIRDEVFSEYRADYAATIDWGDGTQSTGRVLKRDDGRYDVIGSHTFEQKGYARTTDVKVKVTRTLTPLSSSPEAGGDATVQQTFTGNDDGMRFEQHSFVEASTYDGFALSPDLRLTSTRYDSSFAYPYVGESLGESDESLAVLTLGSGTSLEGYAARVEWSDGVVETIRLPAFNINTDRALTLHAARSFATPGQKSGTLFVSDGTTSRSIDVGFYVLPARVTTPSTPQKEYVPQFAAVGFHTLRMVKGVESEQFLGSFRSLHGADPADFNATAYCGAQLRDLRIVASETPGVYDVFATVLALHDDDSYGHHSVNLNLKASSGQDHGVSLGEFVIDVDAGLPNLTVAWSAPFRQFEEFTTTLATFTFADRTATAADFTAIIDWGDGTTSEGVVTPRYKKHGFDITGTHLFRTDGQHPVRITVTGPNGSATTIYGMWTEHHPIDVASTPATTEGFRASGTVATFTDGDLLAGGIDPNVKRINHAALIDWGDGTISTGDIVATGTGTFEVVGDHTYASAGDYTVKVMVRQNAVGVPQLAARVEYQWKDGIGVLATDSRAAYSTGQRDAFWAGVQQRISIRGDADEPNEVDARRAVFTPIAFGAGEGSPPLATLFSADKLFDAEDADVLV